METSTLFPRRLEKHKFLLRSIEEVAFLTKDMGNYPCLTEASTTDQLLNNSPAIQCCENIQESLQTSCQETAKFTKFTQHMNSHNCISEMDLWNIFNDQMPSKHYATTSPTILNFYLNTFSTQILMKCGRRNMIRVLNYFLECVKLLSVLFHLSIHRPASNVSMTTINTVHVLYFRHLRHAYHYMHRCILLNYLILYCVPSTPLTWNKTKKNEFTFMYILFKSHPPHTHPPCTWIYAHPCKTVHNLKNHLISKSQIFPIPVAHNSSRQLDVTGLNCDSPRMYCQDVCISQQANKIIFRCLMEGFNSPFAHLMGHFWVTKWPLFHCSFVTSGGGLRLFRLLNSLIVTSWMSLE